MRGYQLKISISLHSEIPWEELYSIMNFQHFFTFFHPDSPIVPSAYLLYFFWSHLDMLSPATAAHSIKACCSYLPHTIPRFIILDSCCCPFKFQYQPCHTDFNSSCLVLMQALYLQPKLMATSDLPHHGSESPCLPLALRVWPWKSPFSYLFLPLALPPARSSSSTLYPHFPSLAHAKITFPPTSFPYSILKDRKSLRFSHP